ncbi:MAG: AAA family ATPase [Porphyromonadaceae bacterium]|nr:AAA family ATPase [Porphyromonadaceae bacterium]
MKTLFAAFYRKLESITLDFERYLSSQISWDNRLVAITGARGTGKTTLLLQHIKRSYGVHPESVLYTSLDNIYFTTNRLYNLANDFYLSGGKILFLDEVHKYHSWAQEIKNIYDDFPSLKIVFTGSSMLEILKADVDLSRRVRRYQLYGMSFREFLIFENQLPVTQNLYSLEDILTNHTEIAHDIMRTVKPLPLFREYLKYGYYPYYKEDMEGYHERIMQTFNTIIDSDIPSVENIDFYSINRIKKLFYILSSMVPFTPNISQLSQMIDVTRSSLMNYLNLLERAHAVLLLQKSVTGLHKMVKPEKIYLQNTNYLYALSPEKIETGNLRETFFYNQMQVSNKVTYSEDTDFTVNDKYHFEIGGRSKSQRQIQGLENAFLALDDIETGYKNEIPLWLFGLLY